MVSPSSPRLQVENLLNTVSCEDMVAALGPLREAESPKKGAEVIESDAGIRRAPQHSHENRLAHTSLCTHSPKAPRSAFGQGPGATSMHGLASQLHLQLKCDVFVGIITCQLRRLVIANLGLDFGSVGSHVSPGVYQILRPQRGICHQ